MVAPRRAGTLAWFNIVDRTITRSTPSLACMDVWSVHLNPWIIQSTIYAVLPTLYSLPFTQTQHQAPSLTVQHDPVPATRLPPRSLFLLQVQNHCCQAQHTPRNHTLSFFPTSLRDVHHWTAPAHRNLVDPFGLLAMDLCNLYWIVVSVHHTHVSTARGFTCYCICTAG